MRHESWDGIENSPADFPASRLDPKRFDTFSLFKKDSLYLLNKISVFTVLWSLYTGQNNGSI